MYMSSRMLVTGCPIVNRATRARGRQEVHLGTERRWSASCESAACLDESIAVTAITVGLLALLEFASRHRKLASDMVCLSKGEVRLFLSSSERHDITMWT